LAHPGELRLNEVHVGDGKGNVILQPPLAKIVPSILEEQFQELAVRWRVENAIEIGAFTLWMINWVHPFMNGNGRTARALCYTCVSLKLGFVLPGSRTLIDLVMDNRPEYYAALQVADKGYDSRGKPDLTALVSMIDRLLIEQLESV
jgi:Fic family protein